MSKQKYFRVDIVLQIKLMKFNCFRLMYINNKLLRFPHIRYSHTHDEVLPMKKINTISYAPVRYRNTTIPKIETIVTICGGYVDDFNFFFGFGYYSTNIGY